MCLSDEHLTEVGLLIIDTNTRAQPLKFVFSRTSVIVSAIDGRKADACRKALTHLSASVNESHLMRWCHTPVDGIV